MSADLITGISKDPNLGDKIAVTVIATGFNANIIPELKEEQQVVRNVVELNDDDTIVSNNTTIVHETINYTPQKQPIQTTLDFKSNNPQGKMPDLSNPASAETIDKLESEPAYLRKRQNQQNENPEESESNEVSRFSISDDDDKIIKEDNSFLHGNVD
jgi:cell division protein FtsZ